MRMEFPYIFITVLVYCKMDGSEGASAYLLLDDVLVYTMYSSTIIVAATVVRSRVEGFLNTIHEPHHNQRRATCVLS